MYQSVPNIAIPPHPVQPEAIYAREGKDLTERSTNSKCELKFSDLQFSHIFH